MDEVTHTILPNSGSGWGGALGAVTAGTLAQTQNQGATNLAMCQGFGGINSAIDRGIGALNLNIAEQGAQSSRPAVAR